MNGTSKSMTHIESSTPSGLRQRITFEVVAFPWSLFPAQVSIVNRLAFEGKLVSAFYPTPMDFIYTHRDAMTASERKAFLAPHCAEKEG